jgi:hypothetical protein
MYSAGGDNCANEIYHAWFNNGTDWDNVLTSTKGPAPGYVLGGPNKDFSVAAIAPPYGQPAQKAYKEWNTAWNGSYNENSWEITEPAIYYQGSYIALLARVMGNQPPVVLPVRFLHFGGKRKKDGIALQWQIETTEAITHFEVERSFDGQQFYKIAIVPAQSGNTYAYDDNDADVINRSCIYRIKVVKSNGGVAYSKVVSLPLSAIRGFSVSPNPATDEIRVGMSVVKAAEVRVSLVNAFGQVVWEQQYRMSPGQSTKKISISHLPAGVYEVLIASEGYSNSYTIVRL